MSKSTCIWTLPRPPMGCRSNMSAARRRNLVGGRVAVGHANADVAIASGTASAPSRRQLASAGVAVTILPSTDLHLMGRSHDHAVPRGRRGGGALAEGGGDLLNLDQQCPEPVHAIRRRLADPDGKPLCECLPRVAAFRPRRMPRHDHRCCRAADAARNYGIAVGDRPISSVSMRRIPRMQCDAGAAAMGHQAWPAVFYPCASAASSPRN